MNGDAPRFDPSSITRPDQRLLKYYVIVSLLTFLAFPVTMVALYIKFRTLRYRFDDEGVWRRQGFLWRREVNVAYRRIQDIHLTNGLIQRWLGLATVSIQTAAGSATCRASPPTTASTSIRSLREASKWCGVPQRCSTEAARLAGL